MKAAALVILLLPMAARAATVELPEPMPRLTAETSGMATSAATPAPLAPAWAGGLALLSSLGALAWMRRRRFA